MAVLGAQCQVHKDLGQALDSSMNKMIGVHCHHVHIYVHIKFSVPSRVVRLFQVCTLVSGLARMIQVILLSIPDMATIMILLFSIMLVRCPYPNLSANSKRGV